MRLFLRTIMTFGLAMLLAAAASRGCEAQENKPAAAPESPATKDERTETVGLVWQKRLLTELESEARATEAAGLFSAGGWSDAGQKLVLLGKDFAKVLVVPPSGRDVSTTRELTRAEIAEIKKQIEAATKLADVDVPSFDGIVYEYVHAVKVEGVGVGKVDKRVFVRNPGTVKTPEHDALIAAFGKL